MPSSYMPLRSAFNHAKTSGFDTSLFYYCLLRDLQNGTVKAICASYVKAQLRFFDNAKNYAEIVDKFIVPKGSKLKTKNNEPKSIGEPHNVWLDGEYFTFVYVENGVEVYMEKNSERAPGGELSHDFLSTALINVERSEIYCADVLNGQSRIYEKVELLRSDVDKVIGAPLEKAKERRGAKQKYFLETSVSSYAIRQLALNLGRREWEDRVRSILPPADKGMGEKTFQGLYGHLWTKDNEQKKRGN